jgi:hypothetical protein
MVTLKDIVKTKRSSKMKNSIIDIDALRLSTVIQFGFELSRQEKVKHGSDPSPQPDFYIWVKEEDGNGWAVSPVRESRPRTFGFLGGRHVEGPPPKGSFILQVTEV